jgi:type I restriction enzyme S subunit
MLDSRYLGWVVQSDLVIEEIVARSVGVSYPGINGPEIGDISIPVPPVREQRSIANYLDTETARIDALTSRYLELVDRLDDQRGAITVAGVSGGPPAVPRRASSLAWLTEVPAHWDEVRLSLLARLGSGHTPSREHPEWWIDCTIPWITTGEVWQIRDDRIEYLSETREKVSQLGIANSSAELHPAGTVVLSRTASAGFSAIMATDMATSQDYVTWTCGPRLRPRFLLLCLRAMRQDLLGRLAMGSTHQTIYVPDIQSIRIPLPPLEEQDQLVGWTWQRLRRIDAATDAIRCQIDLLTERRQALITAAVTGQLEIPGVAA